MAAQRICSIPGCGKKHNAKGLCHNHYRLNWKYGRTERVRGTPSGAPMEFLNSTLAVSPKSCVLWPYAKDQNGYAKIWVDGRMQPVNRIVCEAAHGPPPSPKHQAAHRCGRSSCISPFCLRWATRRENEADKLIHGTASRGERQGSSKLKTRDVEEIRSVYATGNSSHAKLAKRFGVSEKAIQLIVRRETWAWL